MKRNNKTKKANLHLARRVNGDSRRLRRTSNGDRDVEGKVVCVVSGDVHTTLNASGRAREQTDQLNLTVEGDYARKRALNGLAHITKNDGASSGSLLNKRIQTGDVGIHSTRGVVANDVAGSRYEFKCNG